MENITGILTLAGFFLFFALIVYSMVNSSRKDAEKKRQDALSLGFSPFQPDLVLTEKIKQIYIGGTGQDRRIQLRNVSRKSILDGECWLLDIIEQTNQDSDTAETQAVAIFSPALRLPRFGMYPKPGLEGTAAALADKVLSWAITKFAPLVEFPEYSDFNRNYIVGTHETEAVRKFFSPELLDYLGGTRGVYVRAASDGFIFSVINPQNSQTGQLRLSQKVQQALDLYDAFLSKGSRKQN